MSPRSSIVHSRPAVTEASLSAPWAKSGWRSTGCRSNHPSCSTRRRCAARSRRGSPRSKPAQSTPRSGWARAVCGYSTRGRAGRSMFPPSSRTRSRSSAARMPRRRSPSRPRRSRSSLTGATRMCSKPRRRLRGSARPSSSRVPAGAGRSRPPRSAAGSRSTAGPGGTLQPVIDKTAIPKALRTTKKAVERAPVSAKYLKTRPGVAASSASSRRATAGRSIRPPRAAAIAAALAEKRAEGTRGPKRSRSRPSLAWHPS